jgi:hypothetical protein
MSVVVKKILTIFLVFGALFALLIHSPTCVDHCIFESNVTPSAIFLRWSSTHFAEFALLIEKTQLSLFLVEFEFRLLEPLSYGPNDFSISLMSKIRLVYDLGMYESSAND